MPTGVYAGVKGLQVVQKLGMGTPAMPHRVFESNVAAFVLRPDDDHPVRGPLDPGSSAKTKITDVTLNVVPNIGVGQRAVLVLNNVGGSPAASYSSSSVVATADSGQITLKIENVPTGNYLARVQIDGAESLLTVDPNTQQFTGPMVAMP